MNHTIDELLYRLVTGPLNLEPLRVIARRTISWRDLSVDLNILGASHALTITGDGWQLSELLTCRPAPDASDALIELPCESAVSGCARIFGVECQVRIAPFNLSEGSGLRLPIAPETLFAHEFDSVDGGPSPVTRIGWIAERNVLRVETIHTYPEAGRGVRSETVFTVDEEA